MTKKLMRVLIVSAVACTLALCAGCGQTGIGATTQSASSSGASTEVNVTAAGEYDIEVALSGGSGRASIQSPTKLVVNADGTMTLTVVWSSRSEERRVGKECRL